MEKINTKSCLLKKANLLFTRQGYQRTTVEDIAYHCQIRKSSVFYFFTNKQNLALASMQLILKQYEEEVFVFAYDQAVTFSERVSNFIAALTQFCMNNQDAAVVNFLAIELKGFHTDFDDFFKLYFTKWIKAIKQIFLNKLDEKQAHAIAHLSLAKIYGGCMMMPFNSDANYFTPLCEDLKQNWLSYQKNK